MNYMKKRFESNNYELIHHVVLWCRVLLEMNMPSRVPGV